MKTVEEHYQDWYNRRIGGDMNLSINFVDNDACDFAKYYAEQLSISSVIVSKGKFCKCGAELIKDVVGDEYCGNTLCKKK